MVQQSYNNTEEVVREIEEADDWFLPTYAEDNARSGKPFKVVPPGQWLLLLKSIEKPTVKQKFNKTGKQQQSRFIWQVIATDETDDDDEPIAGREMSTFYSLSMNADSNLVKYVALPMLGEIDPERQYKPSDFRGGVIKAFVTHGKPKPNSKGLKDENGNVIMNTWPNIDSSTAPSKKDMSKVDAWFKEHANDDDEE